MQIFKNGSMVYSSIDNSGSSDEAALGGRFALGLITSLDNRLTEEYYDKEQVIAMLGGISETIVTEELPESPLHNTYYLVGNDDDGYVLYYYDNTGGRATVGNYSYASTSETRYSDIVNKPKVDGVTIEPANTHEDLGLVSKDDFVSTPTGKTDGLEVVTSGGGDGTTSESEIDDSNAVRYSKVHTSSNYAINTRFDAVDNALATRLNYEFVNSLPASPAENTQYYVATDDPAVRHIYIIDKLGETHYLGTSNISLDGLVPETRTIAGKKLESDITASELAEALFQSMALRIYPVGSIYISVPATNPGDVFGGTWTLVGTDRVLWGVGADVTAGQNLAQQLPNIQGNIGDFSYNVVNGGENQATGPFTRFVGSVGIVDVPTQNVRPGLKFSFNANKASSVYTDGGVVRPNAYTVHIWQRTA